METDNYPFRLKPDLFSDLKLIIYKIFLKCNSISLNLIKLARIFVSLIRSLLAYSFSFINLLHLRNLLHNYMYNIYFHFLNFPNNLKVLCEEKCNLHLNFFLSRMYFKEGVILLTLYPTKPREQTFYFGQSVN